MKDLTQKSIFDKERARKDASQKNKGKTSRQLRREAAKAKKFKCIEHATGRLISQASLH